MKTILALLEFYRSAEDISYDYDSLLEEDKEKILNIDIESSFDYEDDYYNYKIYLLIPDTELKRYKKILDDNLIPYICTDVSQAVIKNDINLGKKLLKYVTTNSTQYFNSFNRSINKWIKSNLDLDMVLDMINEKGIKSLRKVDKDFLKTI